jgi:DNA-binding Lrp family transcriptional regulator
MPIKLDAIDRRILRALQRDGRLQNQELAKQVGLSPSPCLRRVRLLEDAGVIERYVALVDPAKVALGLTLFVRVWLKRQDQETTDVFINAVRRLPEVVECRDGGRLRPVATGGGGGSGSYRRFQVAHLTSLDVVQNVKTEVPMEKVKLTTELPV